MGSLLRNKSWPRTLTKSMAYFPDLWAAPDQRILVGWLEKDQPFNRGHIKASFITKLESLYRSRVRQTRGFHVCSLCNGGPFGLPARSGDRDLLLGSAEIDVHDKTGTTYSAPDLLYHYILEHDYAPPEKFIRAVEELP